MNDTWLERLRRDHPDKLRPLDEIFARIRRGQRIFIGTGCGEPQFLARSLAEYAQAHPKAIFDAELYHVWTLGVAPLVQEALEPHFRLNAFFVGDGARDAVNRGLADYTPVFLSQVPDLFRRGLVPVDVALIQTTPPDEHGYVNLGISVDIVRAAVESAAFVVAQVNRNMPWLDGDGSIPLSMIDAVVPHDEPLLEFDQTVPDEVADRIGRFVARIVQDGDTLQVGYGATPNAILEHLRDHRHLGIHSELIGDGVVALMQSGAIDNSRKSVDRGRAVGSFVMGRRETYAYLDRHPAVSLRTIDYTNDPLVIARQRNMTAINAALQIDLTGQATAESLGRRFFSGVGGQADFARGAVLAPGGKTILALQSTARGGTVSRIVSALAEGTGVTAHRGDVHYVVTEYGIAHLHGKNVRERAMDLIAIAHPDFRGALVEMARERHLVYSDQVFVPGKAGEYAEHLEAYRTTKTGLPILLRPVKLSDEALIEDFFRALSDRSLEMRYVGRQLSVPHARRQQLVGIDTTKEMVILAVVPEEEREKVVGLGEYYLDEAKHAAEVAFAVRDDHQGRGIGTELIHYLIFLAKRQGLHGFTAEVRRDNEPMLHLFRKMNFDIETRRDELVFDLTMTFRE